MPVEYGMRIFRFTGAGLLETSFPLPKDTAERRYFCYAEDGSERDLAAGFRSGNGMIWQERPGLVAGNEYVYIFRRHRGTIQIPTAARTSSSILVGEPGRGSARNSSQYD